MLQKAVVFLDDYWTRIANNPKLIRGQTDTIPPIQLRDMNYKPAIVMTKRLADNYFSTLNKQTNLIPYWTDNVIYPSDTSTSNMQWPALASVSADFAEWFPDDPDIKEKALANARAIREYFDYKDELGVSQGMWGMVDSRDGKPTEPKIKLMRIGDTGLGLASLGKRFDDPSLLNFARQKQDFAWNHAENQNLSILANDYTITDKLPATENSDTDTLYYVRYLYDLYEVTSDEVYKQRALAITDLWNRASWNPTYKHFVRKITYDGQPEPVEPRLYGDGKYNTLWINIRAYNATKDQKYLDRFKEAWTALRNMGQEGFFPDRVTNGEMELDKGLDWQGLFLLIISYADSVTNDVWVTQEASEFAQLVATKGDEHLIRTKTRLGEAFLLAALIQSPVYKLEVEMGGQSRTLDILRNGSIIFSQKVPSDIAAVFLPQGTYTAVISAGTAQQEQPITLDDNRSMSWCVDNCGPQRETDPSTPDPIDIVTSPSPPNGTTSPSPESSVESTADTQPTQNTTIPTDSATSVQISKAPSPSQTHRLPTKTSPLPSSSQSKTIAGSSPDKQSQSSQTSVTNPSIRPLTLVQVPPTSNPPLNDDAPATQRPIFTWLNSLWRSLITLFK